jgi:hypothetical protein
MELYGRSNNVFGDLSDIGDFFVELYDLDEIHCRTEFSDVGVCSLTPILPVEVVFFLRIDLGPENFRLSSLILTMLDFDSSSIFFPFTLTLLCHL